MNLISVQFFPDEIFCNNILNFSSEEEGKKGHHHKEEDGVSKNSNDFSCDVWLKFRFLFIFRENMRRKKAIKRSIMMTKDIITTLKRLKLFKCSFISCRFLDFYLYSSK